LSAGLNIQQFGFDELISRMEKAPEAIKDLCNTQLADGMQSIAAEAKQRAPVRYGFLKNNIVSEADPANLTATVESLAEYSAYVEFGTGGLVEVGPEEEEYAMQFKGLKDVTGMIARPFLFPALYRIAPIIVDKISKSLNTDI
jgi:HK97 gp10 family phage protein